MIEANIVKDFTKEEFYTSQLNSDLKYVLFPGLFGDITNKLKERTEDQIKNNIRSLLDVPEKNPIRFGNLFFSLQNSYLKELLNRDPLNDEYHNLMRKFDSDFNEYNGSIMN